MLLRCLLSLSAQKITSDIKLSIIVIENDSKAPSKHIVDTFKRVNATKQHIDVYYETEAVRGIPYARNKALEACRGLKPDWVMFLDDDETAATTWITAHLNAAQIFGADVLQGHVNYLYGIEPPHWYEKPRFKKEHGQRLKRAATNNVAFSFHLIDPGGLNLKFDTHFTQGHEDTEFFERAHALGAHIVLNQNAVTYEYVTASRLAFRRHIERLFQLAVTNTYAQIYKHGRLYAVLKQVTNLRHYSRLFRATIALALVPFVVPFSIRKAQKIGYYAVKRFTKVFGAFYGLTGRQVAYWRTIDGH